MNENEKKNKREIKLIVCGWRLFLIENEQNRQSYLTQMTTISYFVGLLALGSQLSAHKA